MTDNKRILELALKGLEAEKQRIDDEMSEIHRQLGGRTTSAASAAPQAPRSSQPQGQSGGSLTPAGRRKLSELMRRRWAAKRKAGSNTAATSTPSASTQAAKKSSSSSGNLTAAGRKKLSELMKRRWAEKRKAAAKAAR
jgi:hypothetical protein